MKPFLENSECTCDAHPLQTHAWRCGKGLTNEQIWEAENPIPATINKLHREISDLKVRVAKLEKEQEK